MLRIVNYQKRATEEGKEFFVLEVQGGIEMVLSQNTQKYYATAKKAYVSSTFDEAACKTLIGTEMRGSIVKVDCDPFEYTNKETGVVFNLDFTYQYTPEEGVISKEDKALQKLLGDEIQLSRNGMQLEEQTM